CERAGARQRQAYYLGLLAESLWSSERFSEALEHLATAVVVGEGATLSYALLQARLGLWEESARWLEQFAVGERDPHRRLLAQLTAARVGWWRGDRDGAIRLQQQASATAAG